MSCSLFTSSRCWAGSVTAAAARARQGRKRSSGLSSLADDRIRSMSGAQTGVARYPDPRPIGIHLNEKHIMVNGGEIGSEWLVTP